MPGLAVESGVLLLLPEGGPVEAGGTEEGVARAMDDKATAGTRPAAQPGRGRIYDSITDTMGESRSKARQEFEISIGL